MGNASEQENSRPMTRVQDRPSSCHPPASQQGSATTHTQTPERSSTDQESVGGQEPTVENRAPTKSQGPFRDAIFGYIISPWEWEGVRQRLEAALWLGQVPWKRMWSVTVSGDSYFTFQLNTGPGSCWQLLGRFGFRTWVQRNEREQFIPQKKNKAENNLKFGTPFIKETLEGMVSVVTLHGQFPCLKN